MRTGSIAYIDGIPYSVDQVDGENAILHRLNTDGTPVNNEQGNPVTSIVPTATLSTTPDSAQKENDSSAHQSHTQPAPAAEDNSQPATQQAALSQTETDSNGLPFVKASDGSLDFGTVGRHQAVSIGSNVEAPIRLSIGNEGYGLTHMEKHAAQILQNGYRSIEDFVEDVSRNYDEIRQGNLYTDPVTGKTKETFLFVKKGDKGNVLYIELSPDKQYYEVNSGGIFKNRYIEKREVLWNAGTQHSATSGESQGFPPAQLNPESDGVSALPQSSSPVGKDRENEGNTQGHSPLERIPIDKNGKPIYEQSDPETAYDAILQQAEGDTALASRVILSMIDNKEAALKKLSKAKPRRADNPADIINAEKELAAQIKQAESDLQFWKDTALVPSLRNQAQKEAEANSVIQDPSLANTPDSRTRDNDGSRNHQGIGAIQADVASTQENSEERLTHEEALAIISDMEKHAEVAPEIELTPENWVKEFGNDGIVNTPIGEVKQGDNQYLKLAQQGRNSKLGMVRPTLERPSIIILDERHAREGKSDRDTSFVFIKTFIKEDGTRYYYFTSVTVSKEGKEVVISSQERSANRISKLLQQGKIAWIDTAFSLHPTTQVEGSVPLNDSNTPTVTDNQPALLGINSSELSQNKDNEKSPISSDLGEKITNAEAETDTNPTEAQKEDETKHPGTTSSFDDIHPIGHGAFGDIYDQFKGKPQEAIEFLSEKQGGEAIGALHHKDVGDISLVWGNDKAGLKKILAKHPEVTNDIQGILEDMRVIEESDNRIKLDSPTHFAVVSKEIFGTPRDKWLLTAYEKKNSASDNTMDTVGTVTGKQNDTATLQNTVSDNKDSDSPAKKQTDTTNTQTKEKDDAPKERIPKAEKIEDVGEKIGGARKDIIHELTEKARKADSDKSSILDSIRSMPVSKIFNFDYERLRKDGVSNELITLLQVIREIIPSKPRSEYKLRRWTEQVFELYYASLKLITLHDAEQRAFFDKILGINQIDKIYQARMALGGFDSGLNTGKATLEELGENAGHYDKEGNWVSLKGHWYVKNAGKNGGIFTSRKEAEDALRTFAGENASPENSEKNTQFSVYRRNVDGTVFITVKGKPSIIVADGFKNSKEALDYLKTNYADLDAKYRSMKEKTNIAFRENRPRKGRDWRNGKNISAEEFRETFGFRGVEFGNWTNQEDRQQALNNAFDAFMDLADAIGKSPRSLSLNGQLGIAFGARGGGRAAAHYEPDKVVINLTKTQGAGSLAHEWWHAIDNYFARRRGQQHVYNSDRTGYKYNTEKKGAYSENERQELTDAFKELMNAIDNSSYGKRSRAYASMKSSYWSRPTELGARAFAIWIERKLSERGTVNDFLANNPTSTDWGNPDMVTKYYPYPIEGDFDTLDTAFDNLFNAIQEEVDATTGNTILFRELPDQSTTQEQTNDRFNDELSRQIDGTLPKGHIYDLGMPSDTLLNAGLPNLPIEMAASRLSDKSMQENHPFDLSEIRNLPKAIQSPMAIFRSATRLGSFVVMTEIEHHGRNFVVAIQANRRKGRIEVNSIRSVHYRTSNYHIANWVTEGLLEYADKKRMVEWLSKQRYNSADVRKLFNHATNIIQNFDNPKNNNENIRLREMAAEVADAARPAQVTRQIERLAREMNLPIEIIHSIDDIPDEYTRRYIQGEIDGQPHTIVGYYDRTTGKAYIILPAILQTADPLAEAERTILHEVIAHHGMQALMGRDAYDTLCDEVWQSLPYETRARFAAYVLRKNPRDLTITDIARVAASPALRRAAADEYIAALAEGGVENPTLWQRIKAFFRDLLRRLGFYSLTPTDADIRYLLSQARENLAQTSTESVHRGTDIRLSEKNLSNEEQEIIDRANADGTYLKAPNGEETNLTPRQWVQVRTQAFKQWFGDWEKAARIEKLRKATPVEITGNEITPSDDLKQYKKNALEYGKKLQGEYTNKDTGEKIQLQRGRKNGGVNEVLQHNYKDVEHLQSIAAIPQIIKNSIFIDSVENHDTKKNPSITEYQHFVCGLKIGNEDYTVHSLIAIDRNGNRYYDHNLTHIEKTKLLDMINSQAVSNKDFGTTPGNKPTILSDYKGKTLLSILQTNASKVVDTNGEPLVVYHGSNYRPLLASGILLPHEGAMGNAVYFSSAFPEAADYAREKLDDFELSEDEVYDGGYITEAFANVRNEDDISHSKYGIGEIIVAVRNSNQIKSATSNTGAFSSENPDIRLRELSVPEETIDNASRQGNDYARAARTHAAASIDTHNPDLSPVEQAEAVRFRELLTRDFSAASDFLNSANLINAAMQANDGKAAWLNNIQEAVFDSMLRLRLLLDRMKKDGASIPAGFNPYLAENQSRSRAQNRIAAFNEDYRRPLIESLAKCINKLREENIGVEIKDNNAAHEALSLYAQARAAVERQEVKEREAREQAKADGTEYKHREWAGLPGIQYAIIALYKGEITDDVEANKNNLQWLQDFATENNIPTVEQYITMVEDALQKENIDNLWENIRRISNFQLTTSRDAGILSRGSYQLLTYGYNIDNIIETLYKEQRKKITDDINNGIGDKDTLAADLADLDRRHLEAVATATDLDAPDAITTLVAGGWITQDIANDIHRYYNYYLPLKGHAEITGEDLFDYNTPSMPRNASRIKSVRGHEQLARDPFNQILRDAEGCIMQAERNRWKQQLYHVLSTNRSLANGQYAIQRKYYQVIKLDDGTVRYEPYQRVVTTENNEDITTFVPTAEEIAAGTAVLLNSSAEFDIYVSQKQRSEHETIVYIDGSPISILFYDARIAKAVNGTNEAYPPQWMPRAIIQASRTIPALLTSWHPEFVLLSNPIRDTQEAIANAAIDKGFKYTALLARNLATVDRDLWAYTGGKLKQKKDNGQPLSQYEKYVIEFFENGGSVNVTQLSDYETTTKDLKKELKRALKGGKKPSKNFWKRLTEQTELRSRIATYITSRQTGSTIQDAINDAKEITVNFDRRGAQFRNFNLLQMFFNAQMQSVRRQTELMRRHPVRYATTVAILASSKVLIGLGISLLLGGGDDDNTTAEDIIRRYFEINKQLRTRNHIFIIDGEVYRIPVAPAFIPFTTLCEEAAQLAFDPSSHHRNTASQALPSVTSSVLETYVPTLISDPANIMININNEQAWRQSFASGIPMSGRALWQPFIEAIYNYDYTGNPIYTEPQFGAQHLPFHRDYRERTGKAYVYTSKLLSDLTGGNNIIPGKINIHPEQIEHVVQGLAGGIGTLAGRFTGIYKRVQGESAESTGLEFLYDIPFAARLYGGNMQQRENRYYQSLFFDDKQALEAFRAQQRYIESSKDMQDFNKEYNSETRKYFYDFATADKLATKVRKWRDAHQKGSPEYKQYEAILQDIYRTTDDAFNRLQQSNDNEPYEIIDNPYYIYNNIESQLDKELYNVNGTFMTIDDAARAWAARTRRDKKQYYTLSGDLRQIAKIRDEVKEIKKLFKEIGSDYYPGMPLNGRQQYIYRRIEQKTKALSSLYDETEFDNIQLIE